MPTPRKSIEELALSGTLQRHPARYLGKSEQNPVVIEPIGRPPAHLQRAERKAWAELVRSAPPGIWSRADRPALEVAVHLVLKMRQPGAESRDLTALMSVLGTMGLTPRDRKKMGYEAPSQLAEVDPAMAALDELD